MTPPPVHLHLIAYSPETLAQVPPDWLVLDNRANPRPDWFEYGPIRQRLLHGDLDEDAFYGFFSPKFCAKTGLSHAQVQAFVQQQAPQADVLLFSPQPDMGAFFLNVFEQGETFDPGLIDAYGQFLQSIGRPAPLRQMVMDARQVCFSNYFVARPAFWRAWLALNEALYAPGPAARACSARSSCRSAPPRCCWPRNRSGAACRTTPSAWAGRCRAFATTRTRPTPAMHSSAPSATPAGRSTCRPLRRCGSAS
jgi:hypothetical protein